MDQKSPQLRNREKYGKIIGGSVAEWLKAHDSKSCGPKGLGGSNPLASATAWWQCIKK